MLHSFYVRLFPYPTFLIFTTSFTFHVFYVLHFFHVSLFLFCFFFMLHSFHAALFPCGIRFMFCYFHGCLLKRGWNELEQTGMSSNQLEQAGTRWSYQRLALERVRLVRCSGSCSCFEASDKNFAANLQKHKHIELLRIWNFK